MTNNVKNIWLSPTADIVNCPWPFSHDMMAEQVLKFRYKLTNSQIKEQYPNKSFGDILYELGWIKYSTFNNRGWVLLENTIPNERQLQKMNELTGFTNEREQEESNE